MAAKPPMDQKQVENLAVEYISYTVKPGDSLTKIAARFGQDAGMAERVLMQEIFQLNRATFGRNRDELQAGSVLRIPQQRQAAPLLVGSIIHLQNRTNNGGYLDAQGWVADKPQISEWQDQHVRKFVFTHEHNNRLMGSGSWLVLSAEGQPWGKPLQIGDKIHLLNLNPGTGYLDIFEWVNRLSPFTGYPMQTGVFANTTPGLWIIGEAQAADTDETNDKPLLEGAPFCLISEYLHTRTVGGGLRIASASNRAFAQWSITVFGAFLRHKSARLINASHSMRCRLACRAISNAWLYQDSAPSTASW